MKAEFKSREECLREAAEYDRLARLARLKSSRKVLTLAQAGTKRGGAYGRDSKCAHSLNSQSPDLSALDIAHVD